MPSPTRSGPIHSIFSIKTVQPPPQPRLPYLDIKTVHYRQNRLPYPEDITKTRPCGADVVLGR